MKEKLQEVYKGLQDVDPAHRLLDFIMFGGMAAMLHYGLPTFVVEDFYLWRSVIALFLMVWALLHLLVFFGAKFVQMISPYDDEDEEPDLG